jgi:hypothetical protein
MCTLTNFCVLDDIDGITIICLTDDMSQQDAMLLIDHLREHELYHYRLLDFNQYPCQMSSKDIEALAEYDKKFPEKNYGALIAKDNLTYGLMRKYAAHREMDDLATIRVFRTMREGIAWLKKKRHDQDK